MGGKEALGQFWQGNPELVEVGDERREVARERIAGLAADVCRDLEDPLSRQPVRAIRSKTARVTDRRDQFSG